MARPLGAWIGTICGTLAAATIAFSGPLVTLLAMRFGIPAETFGVSLKTTVDLTTGVQSVMAEDPTSFPMDWPVFSGGRFGRPFIGMLGAVQAGETESTSDGVRPTMQVKILADRAEADHQAAAHGAAAIRSALAEQGEANIIVATGASQLGVLAELAKADGIDWTRVSGFHLDEYAGMPITHPASFRLFLWQRFVSRLPLPMREFYYLNAEKECEDECRRVGYVLARRTVDVAFVGIGENAHLAFNDPPADFQTEQPFLIVDLDEACRRQQLGEGWFSSLEDVPRQAVSMSVRQIMKSRAIVCTVPDERKANAAKNAIEGPVTPDVPASILQQHEGAVLFLDPPAAGQLSDR